MRPSEVVWVAASALTAIWMSATTSIWSPWAWDRAPSIMAFVKDLFTS